ncbi:hypothetical protein C2E25_03270 [Geothermobacter hydrogeniphilus]|uniref:Cytochrome c domain-containing protein n=1 Tax=Geothermobacter hydrogeniphilus TaxID=1969733 RepID=A0A2K2HDF7_9BACT|nr:cytochrome c [Geothermobacter hydrogeniphilus]PNU21327.1 hypothetical protein C2E25_03270 [Geothermobacter hydrogeniphilus]
MKFLWLSLLLLIAVPAFGHEDHPGGDHMAGMQAIKDKVPAEYRVMDRSPVTPTADSLARGARLFARNCSVCHGPEGRGDGPAAASMQTRPANFHDAHHSGFYGPGEKYWIISNGLKSSGMPAFGAQLTPQQRWDLVNHVLSLPQKGMNELFN